MKAVTTITFLLISNAAPLTDSLKLQSPINFRRPLDDVHTHCQEDVTNFCSNKNNLVTHTEDINVANTDEVDARRRLGEEHQEVVSRKFYISVGFQTGTRDQEEAVLHSRSNHRFMNFGEYADMCLWNAFDAGKVSDMCSSALSYFNETEDSTPYINYGETHRVEYTKISISFSGQFIFALCAGAVFYIVKSWMDDDDGKNDDDDENIDYENGYQPLHESRQMAFVAVPVQIV
jgi:hypothetical protein